MSIENAKALIALVQQDNALGLPCNSSHIEEAYKLLDDGLWILPAGTASVSGLERELSDEERAEHRWLLDTMAQLARDGEDAGAGEN